MAYFNKNLTRVFEEQSIANFGLKVNSKFEIKFKDYQARQIDRSQFIISNIFVLKRQFLSVRFPFLPGRSFLRFRIFC